MIRARLAFATTPALRRLARYLGIDPRRDARERLIRRINRRLKEDDHG